MEAESASGGKGNNLFHFGKTIFIFVRISGKIEIYNK